MLDVYKGYFEQSPFTKFLSLSEDAKESSESSSAKYHLASLDDSLAAFKISPFKSTGKSKHQKLIQANKKIDKVTKKLEKAFATKGIDVATSSTPPNLRSKDEKDFDQLMHE